LTVTASNGPASSISFSRSARSPARLGRLDRLAEIDRLDFCAWSPRWRFTAMHSTRAPSGRLRRPCSCKHGEMNQDVADLGIVGDDESQSPA
jgi:hypothetical protein